MRKSAFAVTLAAVLGLGGAAYADGMYKGSKYVAPGHDALPVNTWSGFYFGLNGGYAFSADEKNIGYDIPVAGIGRIAATRGFETEGAFGGAQVGYNWQAGRMVLGLEADLQGAEVSSTFSQPLVAGFVTVRGTQEVDYFGTLRGRLGYDFGQTMIYATGGFAYANVETTITGRALGVIDFARVSKSDTETGYVVGGGFEHKLSPSWSVKAEYQYIDLGGSKLNGDILGFIPLRTNEIDHDFHTVRIGVNYRINPYSDYAPLK